ncbi:MAG: hypothetical protein ACK6CP_22130 [Pseudanabaena sp.]
MAYQLLNFAIAITVNRDFYAIASIIYFLKAIAITVSRDFRRSLQLSIY